MKRKPIKIGWDELEQAFSDTQAENVFYLDLITGHVLLEGEGEEGDDDDAFEALATTRAPERKDPTRLEIRPPDTARRREWMMEFLKRGPAGGSPEIAAELTEAMQADDPVTAVRAILDRNPELRDAWYAYRAERLHEMIDEWLASEGIEATEPPPWRS